MSQWNLGDLFEVVVDAVPDREAVVDGRTRTSFAELDRRANAAATLLDRSGVGPGDRVGAAAAQRAPVPRAAARRVQARGHAVQRARPLHRRRAARPARRRPAPAGRATSRTSADRLAGALDAGAPTLAVDAAYEPRPVGTAPAARPAPGGRAAATTATSSTPAGTTGDARGRRVAPRRLCSSARSATAAGDEPAPDRPRTSWSAGRSPSRLRCLPASPLNHGTAQWSALATLFGGGHGRRSTGRLRRRATLWSTVEAEAVTTLVIVGDAFARPLADALAAEPDRWDLSRPAVHRVAAAPCCRPRSARSCSRRLPWVAVVDGYGTSETGGVGPQRGLARARPTRARSRFQVGDDDRGARRGRAAGRPRRRAQVGMVARRGAHARSATTATTPRAPAAFPVIDGVRWAVPGDLATVEADGRIRCSAGGRARSTRGGEKVSPEEVEAVLKAHPTCSTPSSLGVADDRWGERVVGGGPAPPRRAPWTSTASTGHCRTELADFKVPRQVVLVDAIERLSTGKPDLRLGASVVDRNVDRHADPSVDRRPGYRSR